MKRYLICLFGCCLLGCAHHKVTIPAPPELAAEGAPPIDLQRARRFGQIATEVGNLPKGKLAELLRKSVRKKHPTPAEVNKAQITLPNGIVTTLAEINEAVAFVQAHSPPKSD